MKAEKANPTVTTEREHRYPRALTLHAMHDASDGVWKCYTVYQQPKFIRQKLAAELQLLEQPLRHTLVDYNPWPTRPISSSYVGQDADQGHSFIFSTSLFTHSLPKISLTIKTPNPKCRLYWCLIEFIDWRSNQSCWFFRPALWTIAPVTFTLVSSPPPFPLLCVNKYTVYTYTYTMCKGGGGMVS